MKRVLLIALTLSALASLACEPTPAPVSPTPGTTEAPKADAGMAEAPKADAGMAEAPKADAGMAEAPKADAGAPAADAGSAPAADAGAAPAADAGAANPGGAPADAGAANPADAGAAGNGTPVAADDKLAPGQNDKSFLEGIEGNGPKLLALIETSKGDLECELFEKKTPETIMNFVGLARGLKKFQDPSSGQWVKKPFFDGIAFHRVIPGFMSQVGDPTGTGRYSPGFRFKDEFDPSLRHDKGGILSMANAGPGTNGSQIFITEVPTPHLDNRHTVFGSCTPESVKVIVAINAVPTGPGDKPLEPVLIKSVKFRRGQ
jgi:peptidyl-prolyl cis-trans isomerase A (cyclophilin A)